MGFQISDIVRDWLEILNWAKKIMKGNSRGENSGEKNLCKNSVTRQIDKYIRKK